MDTSIEQLHNFKFRDYKFRGKRGKRNLLVIGLYAVDYDDFLSRVALQNMDAIAKDEGYDGWIRASLCPFIDARKLNSSNLFYEYMVHYNSILLSNLLQEKDINVADVWLMWGDGVEDKNRQFLKKAVGYLYGNLLKYDLRYWCIWRTRRANPKDCSPESLNGIIPEVEAPNFIKFDFQHYVHYRKLALYPNILLV